MKFDLDNLSQLLASFDDSREAGAIREILEDLQVLCEEADIFFEVAKLLQCQ